MGDQEAWTLESVFADRHQAGVRLAEELVRRKVRVDAVIGLTRGGAPVAFEVAAALGVPLDILVVKKLRAPENEELAIGAICSNGAVVLQNETIKALAVPPRYLAREMSDRLAKAREAEEAYRGSHGPLELAGKQVAIVDDGIATGATIEVAVLNVRRRGASRVTVAVPVGSPHACEHLRESADEVICLRAPDYFWAVGQFYLRFAPVPDQEVRRLLEQARAVQV